MALVVDIASWVFMIIGGVFVLLGGVGACCATTEFKRLHTRMVVIQAAKLLNPEAPANSGENERECGGAQQAPERRSHE